MLSKWLHYLVDWPKASTCSDQVISILILQSWYESSEIIPPISSKLSTRDNIKIIPPKEAIAGITVAQSWHQQCSSANAVSAILYLLTFSPQRRENHVRSLELIRPWSI